MSGAVEVASPRHESARALVWAAENNRYIQRKVYAARRAVNTADPGAGLARGYGTRIDANLVGFAELPWAVHWLELLVRCPAKAGHYGRLSRWPPIASLR